MAIDNGIKLENYITIDCRKSDLEHIKNNIINSKLNEIFDLNEVDWVKIGQDSEKSLVKQVCDYWKNNKPNNNFKYFIFRRRFTNFSSFTLRIFKENN